MILTTHKDLVYSRKKQVSLNKLKRRGDVENLEQPTTSKINVTVEDDKVLVVPSKLRTIPLLKMIPVTLVKMICSLNQRK